ncbi:MAG: repeat protein [Phycisphaerales bacterium]|nr:repeat protein [Phycisphaerales bacterium]
MHRAACITAGLCLLWAAPLFAQVAATRPSAMADMPIPSAAIDPHIAVLTDDGQLVQVLRNFKTADRPTDALAVCTQAGKQLREWPVQLLIRDLAPAGPGRVLLWGRLIRPPGQNRQQPISAQLWDLKTQTVLKQFEVAGGAEISCAAISGDGSRVLIAQQDGTLHLFDADRGRELRAIQTQHPTGPIALSRDGRRAVIGGGDRDEGVYVWDLIRDREIAHGVGHHAAVSSVAFSKDEQTILTSSLDGSTRLWDAATGKEVATLRPSGVPVVRAVFSLDERRVLTTLGNRSLDGPDTVIKPGNQLRLWNVADARLVMRYDTADSEVGAAGFSADGRQIIASIGGEIWTWGGAADAPSEPPAIVLAATRPSAAATRPASQPNSSGPFVTEQADPAAAPARSATFLGGDVAGDAETVAVHCVGFLPNGQAYAVRPNRTVEVWDLARQARVARHLPAAGENLPPVSGLSADGRLVISGGQPGRGQLTLWDRVSGLTALDIAPNGQATLATAVSPDGKLAAVARWLVNEHGNAIAGAARPIGTLTTFYRTNDGGSVAGTIKSPNDMAQSLGFTPDGNRLVVTGKDVRAIVQEFDLDTGRRAATYAINATDQLSGFVYATNGERLAGLSARTAYVWETRTSRRLLRLMFTSTLTAITISPDGKRLITGGADSNVRIYDIDAKVNVGRFDEPRGPIESLAVSPDGKWVVAASGEKGFWSFKLP